jgi:hypothetical protein
MDCATRLGIELPVLLFGFSGVVFNTIISIVSAVRINTAFGCIHSVGAISFAF